MASSLLGPSRSRRVGVQWHSGHITGLRNQAFGHSRVQHSSGAVQVCPQEECRLFGCPGHEFAAKGLRGCGIDTASAAIGTEVRLDFLVADRGVPALTATATRTVRIVQRCPQGLNYCAADQTCSVVRSVGLLWVCGMVGEYPLCARCMGN